jgi:hypothetical protein
MASEEEFDASLPGASEPTSFRERESYRRFQLQVLKIFVITVAGVMLIDMAYHKLIDVPATTVVWEKLLAVVAPIFTFLLGMSTRPS